MPVRFPTPISAGTIDWRPVLLKPEVMLIRPVTRAPFTPADGPFSSPWSNVFSVVL